MDSDNKDFLVSSEAIAGKDLLVNLKRMAVKGNAILCIPVGRPIKALLRPVATRAESLDAGDVGVLTRWRNKYVSAFLTEFEATEKQTKEWLVNYVGISDNKILFMVDDPMGETIGYMGLDYINWEMKTGEADAIVRGKQAPKGMMSAAIKTMLAWANLQLGLNKLGVRVRSDNTALEFYKKVGFQETSRIPLVKIINGDISRWVESPKNTNTDVCLVHLEYHQNNII